MSQTRPQIIKLAWILTALLTVAVLQSVIPHITNASAPVRSSGIAQVRFILHGLTVQPPHKQIAKARVKDPLYDLYSLSTRAREKASVSFSDGSILNLNQLTNA